VLGMDEEHYFQEDLENLIKKENIVDTLTKEIVGAFNNDTSKSQAVKEKERVEREAEGAR